MLIFSKDIFAWSIVTMSKFNLKENMSSVLDPLEDRSDTKKFQGQ